MNQPGTRTRGFLKGRGHKTDVTEPADFEECIAHAIIILNSWLKQDINEILRGAAPKHYDMSHSAIAERTFDGASRQIPTPLRVLVSIFEHEIS